MTFLALVIVEIRISKQREQAFSAHPPTVLQSFQKAQSE